MNWPDWPAQKQLIIPEPFGFWSEIKSWFRIWKIKRSNSFIADNVKCYGKTVVKNKGQLNIGAQTILCSDFQPIRLAIGKEAQLTIGKNCFLNSVIIAANQSVEIGDHCRFGPFVHLMDSDFHDLHDRTAAGKAGPISIGEGVQLGTRVIVLHSVTIGKNAVVLPGSVVTKDVPSGAIVGGVPAKKI